MAGWHTVQRMYGHLWRSIVSMATQQRKWPCVMTPHYHHYRSTDRKDRWIVGQTDQSMGGAKRMNVVSMETC